MLKFGIMLIGISLGVGVYVPRANGGLLILTILLITGVVFVVIAPNRFTCEKPHDQHEPATPPGQTDLL